MTWQERINKMFATAGDIKTALINNFTTRINNGTLKELFNKCKNIVYGY